ncbi:MAG TPA: AAA family ATPase [Chloroflexota bacterium]|nr:AAA family ATPase [Chloroflexota bacterium]
MTAQDLRLVGRGSEIAALESELRTAAAGQVRCVLLLADSGLGKTRLAAELLSRNCRWALGLTARAYPLGATASFGLWVEALERYLRNLHPEKISELCGGFLDDLASLLRSVAATRGSVRARQPSRIRLLEGLAVLLRNLAREAPLIVFLDDAHWADASSWETLNYLARNLPGSRLLLLAAARPAELSGQHLPNEVLIGLEQAGVLRRMSPPPLGPNQIGALAQGMLGQRAAPGALVDWLFERSRGNPLFALDLVQALVDEGADLSAPRLRRLPEGLSERVRNRLRLLDEATLATLETLAVLGQRIELNPATRRGLFTGPSETLAVLGQRIELSELANISRRPLDRLGRILEELVRLRLITEEERDRELTYEVAHPLIQEAIYHGIGGARRRALHRLVARALLAAGRLAAAASHFACSAEVGDPEAIDALVRAIRQAEERESHREALAILGALLELLPPGDKRWLDVLDGMAWQAEWVIDHRADVAAETGAKAMQEIDSLLEGSPDYARRGGVQFRLTSFLAWGSGDLDTAQRTGRRALELFEQAGQAGRVLIAANELGWIRGLAGDLAGQEAAAREVLQGAAKTCLWSVLANPASDAAREVLQGARLVGDRLATMQALGSLGTAAGYRGHFAEAEAALRQSASIAREDGKPYCLTWNLSLLATVLAFEGRLEEAFGLLEEATAANPAYSDTILLELSAQVHWLAGDFGSAIASTKESAARNAGGLSRRRAWAMAVAAIAAVEMGQPDEARDYLSQATSAYDGREFYVFSHYCAWAAAVLAWRAGNLPEALAGLRQAASSFLAMGALPCAAFVLTDLVEVAAQAADHAAATEAALQLGQIVQQIDRDLYRALAGIAAGWVALGAGNSEAALEPAREAARMLAASGYAGFHGRSLDVLGRALSGSDRGEAVEALQAAADRFATCGATWRRDRALVGLSKLGHRGKRATATILGPESLTRREREVVRLAIEGHTAREIGRRLFIGERTVETHLASAYAKLGVGSKLDLVRNASQLQL